MQQYPTVGKYFFLGFFLVLGVILTDQYTKWLVVETVLRLGGPASGGFFDWFTTLKKIEFFFSEREHFKTVELHPYLNFTMVWNQGISFGMLNTNSPNMPLLFIAVSMTVSLMMILWLALASRRTVACSLGLIIGGALANVIDRVRFAAVIDFIDVHVGPYHWPAFNLADSCISVGATILILDTFLNEDRKRKNT